MFHRSLLTTVLSVSIPILMQAQLQRIVVQGTGSPQVFADLTSALAAAQTNDKLYISGGTFAVTGDLVIDKPLHFIGAGIDPDSTNVTGTTAVSPSGVTQILTAASGSSFTGIRFVNTLQYGNGTSDFSPTDIVFQRCEFMYFTNLGAGSSSTFDECIFQGRFYGYDGRAVVTRSLFPNAGSATNTAISSFSTGGLFMSNCVVLGGRINGCDYAIVRNSIFTRTTSPFTSNGMTVTNNLLVSPDLMGAVGGYLASGNIVGVDPANIFIDPASDWHLVPGSPGIGAGNDGYDIGMYGTHSPYKPGSVPYNPHYRQATIDPSTDWNGALPVQIRTAAQTH